MGGKKDFSAALNAGVERERTIRDGKVASRFEQVSAALDGRESLLEARGDQRARGTPRKPEQAPEAWAEALEREGRVHSRYVAWPVAQIDDNPLNSRAIYHEEKIVARAASMARDGQLQPVLAAQHPDDTSRVILIDGHYRKQGALRNGEATLDIRLLEGLQPIDFYRLARAANNEREQETVLDVAFGYRKLLDEGYVRSNDELARLVGEARSQVTKFLSLLELPRAVQDLMATHPGQFGVNVSYELALYQKLTDTARTEALARRVCEEGLSFQKVKALREALTQERAPRRALARHYRVSADDGTPIGDMRVWGDGQIQVQLDLGSAQRAEAYIASLRRMLARDGHDAT